MEWLVPYRLDDVDFGSGKAATAAPDQSQEAAESVPADSTAVSLGWWESVLLAASRMWVGAW
jgi:hypothetical protein